MPNQMRPVHPGEILKGEMEELGLSARQLAMALGVPTNRVTSIVHEARALTADTALLLDVHFISSLPVKRLSACMAWGDKRPAQIAEAES